MNHKTEIQKLNFSKCVLGVTIYILLLFSFTTNVYATGTNSVSNLNIVKVTFGNNMFVGIGNVLPYDNSTYHRIIYSRDGINWYKSNLPDTYMPLLSLVQRFTDFV